MKVLDSISVVGATDFGSERMDVCSETDCTYDPAAQELVVSLDSFLRHAVAELHDQRVKAPWLPAPQTVRERVPFDEAGDLAHDIAQSWRRKVAGSVPDRLLH
jgi:hypothetical protein